MKYYKRIKDYIYKDKRVFAKGLCREKLFFVFIFGCLFGCLWEETLNLYFSYKYTGAFEFVTRRGLIYGELSPVYGWGAVIILYLLLRRKRTLLENFIYGSLIGGVFEYLMSLTQELLTGMISWDYSDKFLNINGRTTIPYMLVWGLLSLLFIYIIYPYVSNLIESIPYNLGVIIYNVLLVFIIFDMFISYGAVLKQTLRHAGYRTHTFLGRFFDTYYPDARIAQAYTNARVK